MMDQEKERKHTRKENIESPNSDPKPGVKNK
jgi:hypothetical protein